MVGCDNQDVSIKFFYLGMEKNHEILLLKHFSYLWYHSVCENKSAVMLITLY